MREETLLGTSLTIGQFYCTPVGEKQYSSTQRVRINKNKTITHKSETMMGVRRFEMLARVKLNESEY